MLTFLISVLRFNILEQVRVVAYLPELDQNVLVMSDRVGLLNHTFHEQVSVNLLLLLSDTDLHMYLDFWRQRLLDFLLDTTQKEWLENPVQLLNNLLITFLFFSLAHFSVCLAKVEPFIEVVA